MFEIVVPVIVSMFSVLVPTRMWYAPDQPLEVRIEAEERVKLVLTDFDGLRLLPQQPAEVEAGQVVNLLEFFPQQLGVPGTYILYAHAAPEEAEREEAFAPAALQETDAVDDAETPPDIAPELSPFLGTPVVIDVRIDRRRGAVPQPMVIKVEPLRYAIMHTDHGELAIAFYYDVAPNTAAHFMALSEGGFYDGLTFHRIVPQFVIQGGDPRDDGTGGPGYQIQAEFNERPHLEGVLSMARSGDPREGPGVMPRPEIANSAGSQFFICLDYENTRQLDRRYTAFARVVAGMEEVQAIAQAPIADPRTGRPQQPQVIRRVEVRPVTAEENPYPRLHEMAETEAVPLPLPLPVPAP